MQIEETCPESELVFYGREVSRLLQDHDSFQSRADGSAVCRMFHCAVPADWWKGASD